MICATGPLLFVCKCKPNNRLSLFGFRRPNRSKFLISGNQMGCAATEHSLSQNKNYVELHFVFIHRLPR